MIRRLQTSIDFERVLRTRSRASSLHFAVHHLPGRPEPRGPRPAPAAATAGDELSTGAGLAAGQTVDEGAAPPGIWFGAVVPKRHARRAVTRSLLKRQIRNIVGEGVGALADGLWVVRLRAPFDRAKFPSAASEALRRQARSELQEVLATAAEGLQRR